MRAANDPIPVLRRVVQFLERDDVRCAADSYLEGLRRVLTADVVSHGIALPPSNLSRGTQLALMLRSLRRCAADPLDAQSFKLWQKSISVAQATIEGRRHDPGEIATACLTLTSAYLKQWYAVPTAGISELKDLNLLPAYCQSPPN